MAGLMVSLFVAAMDSTVVSTALPTIARDLGGFSLYPWVFTGFLLTSTTTVPLGGRLADMIGRKRVLLAGLAVFVGASVLCGLAPSMPFLIVFRAVQGIGAGCLQPVVFTIVGDTFPTAQRARLQGFFSAVWAVAAVIGPVLGAVFVSTVGWRWVFDINLPIGIVAAILIWFYREERPARAGRGLDLGGAALLTAGVAALLWGLGSGSAGAQPNWPLVGAGAILIVLFVLVEARVASPTVPLDLLRHPVVGPAMVATILAGTVMFGLSAYVPLFVQDGLGRTAYLAGAALAPMSVGWPVGSIVAGRLLIRIGHRPLLVAGATAAAAGSLLLAAGPSTVATVASACAVVGLGLGLISTPVLIVVQSTVEWGRRGAATALNQFSRTIGGAISVSLLGLLLEHGSPSSKEALRTLASQGIHHIFWVVFAVAVATLLTALLIFMGRRAPAQREPGPHQGAAPVAVTPVAVTSVTAPQAGPVIAISSAGGAADHAIAEAVATRLGLRLIDLSSHGDGLEEALRSRGAALLPLVIGALPSALSKDLSGLRRDVIEAASSGGAVVLGGEAAPAFRADLRVGLGESEEPATHVHLLLDATRLDPEVCAAAITEAARFMPAATAPPSNQAASGPLAGAAG
jgi:EmrB/QacA subfamily drug resistance transporter